MRFFHLRVLLGVLVLVPQVLTAQKMRLEWAEEAHPEGWQSIEPIGQVDDRLYFLSVREQGRFLVYFLFSYSLELTDPREVFLLKFEKTTNFIQDYAEYWIDVSERKLFITYNIADYTSDRMLTLLNIYALDGNPVSENIPLSAYPYTRGIPHDATTSICASQDSSFIAVSQLMPPKDATSARMLVQVYRKNFSSLVWIRTFDLAFTSKYWRLLSEAVDNSGKFYVFYDIDEFYKKSGEYQMRSTGGIFILDSTNSPTDIKIDNVDLESIGFARLKSGKIKVLGFCRPRDLPDGGVSYFSFLLDPVANQAINQVNVSVPQLSDSQVSARKRYHTRLSDLLRLNEAGDVALLAESYRIEKTILVNDMGGEIETSDHTYGPMAVVKLNASQEVEWVRRVPKLQHTTSDGGVYSSFYGFLYNGNVVLVYNDDPDNLTVLEDSRYNDLDQSRRMKRAAIMAATVAPDGTLQKQQLQAYDPTLGVAIVPRLSQPINDTTHLVVARWGKAYRIGRLVVAD